MLASGDCAWRVLEMILLVRRDSGLGLGDLSCMVNRRTRHKPKKASTQPCKTCGFCAGFAHVAFGHDILTVHEA